MRGVTWGLVGDSVKENGTVEHIGELLKAGKQRGYDIFICPHYDYPTDRGWQVGGAVEKMMHEIVNADGGRGTAWFRGLLQAKNR